MDFTPSQRSAIEFAGTNLQLIACAGSGKTEVVARRVVHLLRPEAEGLLPRNIVAFTFTDKAAAELKDRIVRRVRESLGEIPGLADMFVGPLSGRVTAKQINDAVQDALSSGILEVHLLGWVFEANVRDIKSQLEKRGRVKVVLVMIRPDTLAEGLKATQPEMLFSPLALPEIEPAVAKNSKAEKQLRVMLKSVALYDRKRRTTEYKAALRAEADPEEFTLKLTSEPFPVRRYKRIAVKVVDVYGNESTVVRDLPT